MTEIRYFFMLFVLLCISTFSYAAIPAWKIIPDKSTLSFSATQNGSPVTGKFKTFTGKIDFDPSQLTSSQVRIIVDMNSVTTSYKDVGDTLKTSDWFDIKLFPEAIFVAKKWTKVKDNHYLADGTLTIRNKTLPLQLAFTLDEYSATEARVTGEAVIKRTKFGVGQGEWSSTDEIKDDVKVIFSVVAFKL